jgi:secretion/DNA translocation related TadE-like protein
VGVAVVAGVVALTVALATIGTAVLARHHATAAAELGALAAASVLMTDSAEPCATAARIVRAQGDPRLHLDACDIDGEQVELHVSASVSLGRFGIRTARVRARAGPIGS